MKGRDKSSLNSQRLIGYPSNHFTVYEKQFTLYVFFLSESIIVCSSAAFDARRAELAVWRADYSLLNEGGGLRTAD
jgi:hypothetical protein